MRTAKIGPDLRFLWPEFHPITSARYLPPQDPPSVENDSKQSDEFQAKVTSVEVTDTKIVLRDQILCPLNVGVPLPA